MSSDFALQGPDEDLDYYHDWNADLDDQGSPSDTISTSTWTLVGPDVGGSPSPSTHDSTNSAGITGAWVTALNLGHVYRLQNIINTAAGRAFEHSWTIRCGYR